MNTPSAAHSTSAPPHWHVLGAGAIGGLWALRLIRRGLAVTLLSPQPGDGTRRLSIREQDQDFHHRFPEHHAGQTGSPITHLLVCTKAQHSARALTPVLPQLSEQAVVLLLQNGMGQEDSLRQQYPQGRWLAGTSTDGVWRQSRDQLVLAGCGETFIGALQPRDAACAQTIAQQFHDPRWPVHFAADIARRRWLKLAINCAINPLTALYRCKNGDLLQDAEARACMQAVCAEVAMVMTAQGLAATAEQLFATACATAEKTANNYSSMYSDIVAGRDTEIDFISGHILSCARQHGIAAPTHEMLIARIHALKPH